MLHRIAVNRFLTSTAAPGCGGVVGRVVRRGFSTEIVSRSQDKLRAIMEDYRQANFQLEVPSRVVKLILKATDENNDGFISVQEVENLLKRIGAQDRLSKKEIEEVMLEIGIDEGAAGVSITKLKDLLMPPKMK